MTIKPLNMLLKGGICGCAALLCATTALYCASQSWKSDPRQWTPQQIDRLLSDSPWAQSAGAVFALAGDDKPPPPEIQVPQAGMPNPRSAATDGHWDGGVGRVNRNGSPTLNVTVRWDSALPVRQALEVRQALQHEKSAPAYSAEQCRRDYIITVLGLARAGDVRNPVEMLEGVMRYSALYPRGQSTLHPEDAKFDSITGALHLFFPRTEPLGLSNKEVIFETRFGSLSVQKKFRLKDMLYKGQLEL